MAALNRNFFLDKTESSVAQYLGEFAGFVHLGHDVRAADEFALDVKLGNGRPVAVFLDTLADISVVQHIDGGQGFGVHAAGFEQLNGTT